MQLQVLRIQWTVAFALFDKYGLFFKFSEFIKISSIITITSFVKNHSGNGYKTEKHSKRVQNVEIIVEVKLPAFRILLSCPSNKSTYTVQYPRFTYAQY